MDKAKEIQLFDFLARHRPLKEWLEDQMAKQVNVLLVNADHGAILKAQGAAAFIKGMQDRISAAENAAKR